MSGYWSRLFLALLIIPSLLSVEASKPEDWDSIAAPDATVKKINTGKANRADTNVLPKAAALTPTDTAMPKVQLKTAMAQTSSEVSEEIPPPPPPMEDSHLWVEPRAEVPATSAVAVGASGMLRREASVEGKSKKSLHVGGVGKLQPHNFAAIQDEVHDEEAAAEDQSSLPTAADLGEDQMRVLKDIDSRSGNSPQQTRAAASLVQKHQQQPGDQQKEELFRKRAEIMHRVIANEQRVKREAPENPRMHQVKSTQRLRHPQPLPWDALMTKLSSGPAQRGRAGDEGPIKGRRRGLPSSMAQGKMFSYGRDASKSGPSWLSANPGGALKFEYQSAIGRDGFEPDPTGPSAEYFGPFKIDYSTHTITLNNWNMAIGTELKHYGMGNLIVGNNHSYQEARNGVILGDSNILKGSYGLVAGQYNLAKGRGAVVDGGRGNKELADYGTVGGGSSNNVTATFGVVQAGEGNSVTAPFASASGGQDNLADGYSASVSGKGNKALANLSSVISGEGNEIPANMVSETIAGGHNAGTPTEPPSEVLTVEAGEHAAKPESQEIDFSTLGCASAKECEEEEEEEVGDGPEDDAEHNPATKTRLIAGGNQIDPDGSIRRRRTDAHEKSHLGGPGILGDIGGR